MRLAIEASTSVGGAAVGDGDVLLAEVVIGVQAKHSAALLPAIDFALRHAGIEARDLDAIIVGAGPGSFTGVRVAAATARGMASALTVPLFTASSLAALALSAAPFDRPVCAFFDARRDQLYAACYRPTADSLEALAEPQACSLDEAIAMARTHDAVCAGEGAQAHASAIRAAGLSIANQMHAVPRPSALLRLVAMGAHGVAPAARGWEPQYLRPSSAERQPAR